MRQYTDAGMKAIETTGTVDTEGQLHLDEPLASLGSSRVRVIVLFPDEVDISEREWLRAAANNSAFDFLKDQEEDIYTLQDGKPFHAERLGLSLRRENRARE